MAAPRRGSLAWWLSRPKRDIALAAEEQRRRKERRGSKLTREHVAKVLATKARKREERIRQRMAEKEAARRKPIQGLLTVRLLAVMEPGEWYARPDIRDLSGVDYDSVKGRIVSMLKAGLVERGLDPDYRPVPYVKGVPIDRQLDRPPKYLYRITPAGERRLARDFYLL